MNAFCQDKRDEQAHINVIGADLSRDSEPSALTSLDLRLARRLERTLAVHYVFDLLHECNPVLLRYHFLLD